MFIPPSNGPTNTVNTGCGDDNVHISKADGLAGLLGLYEVNINGQKQYMTKQQLENTQFNLGCGQRPRWWSTPTSPPTSTPTAARATT